jgi:phosphoglycolate phosphatase
MSSKVASPFCRCNTQFVAKYERLSAELLIAELGMMADILLIFDLDGTLVDSVPDLTDALNKVLHEHGYLPLTRDEVTPMVGDGVKELVTRAFAARGAPPGLAAEILPHYVKLYEANATNLSRLYPGVRETLTDLRRLGYRTAVCTNKLHQATIAVLHGFGITDLFDAIAGGDRYPVKKPNAGHLLLLIDELGGSAERAVMIGDSENDAGVAHAAAVPLVLMTYGYSRVALETLGAKSILDNFADLPRAVERLGLLP